MILGVTAKKDPSGDRKIVRGGFGPTSSRVSLPNSGSGGSELRVLGVITAHIDHISLLIWQLDNWQ